MKKPGEAQEANSFIHTKPASAASPVLCMHKLALVKRLPKAGFVRSVLTLMTGTAIAQAIPIAISPILTRLYTPEDFGLLAIFMAICGIISTVATARYELAIILPKDEESAINIVALSIAVAAGVSIVLLLIVIAFNGFITGLLGKAEIGNWLYWIPLSIFLIAVYQSLNFWANRKKEFSRMASSRIAQSVGMSGTQLTTGWAFPGSGGLILGYIAGQILSSFQLLRLMYKEDRAVLGSITVPKCKEMALAYSNHPKYLVVSHGISSIYNFIPIFFVSKFFSLIDTGHVSLAYRMVTIPSALIANSIGDVFRQRAAEEFHKKGRFDHVFRKTIVISALLGLPFILIISFFAEDIFALVFGENWRVAGKPAKILAVAAYFQFVLTPVDKAALIRSKLGYIFNWHLIKLLAFLLVSVCSWYFGLNMIQFLTGIVLSNVIFYCVDGIFEYRFSKGL